MRSIGRAAAAPVVLAALVVAGSTGAAHAQARDSSDTIVMTLLLGAIAIVYFIPSMVGFSRRHPNRWPILAINLLFGGTGLGWIGSLIWACGAVHRSPTGNHGGESGLNIFANDPVTVRLESVSNVSTVDRTVERLGRLKVLLDQGAIQREEYDRLRAHLLADLAEK